MELNNYYSPIIKSSDFVVVITLYDTFWSFSSFILSILMSSKTLSYYKIISAGNTSPYDTFPVKFNIKEALSLSSLISSIFHIR